MTPDVSAMKHVTSTGVSTDGDVDSEPMTPWNSTSLTKTLMHVPSTELLTVLMEYLPKIVPNVLIKKRSGIHGILLPILDDNDCRLHSRPGRPVPRSS